MYGKRLNHLSLADSLSFASCVLLFPQIGNWGPERLYKMFQAHSKNVAELESYLQLVIPKPMLLNSMWKDNSSAKAMGRLGRKILDAEYIVQLPAKRESIEGLEME